MRALAIVLPAAIVPATAQAQSMPGMQMGPPAAPGAVAPLPGGAEAPPAAPTDHYADRTYPLADMEAARARMMREEGGQTLHQVVVNLAEAQFRDGHAGYRWDAEAWVGGDIDRLVVRSEGSGSGRNGTDAADVQLLYSRAIGPYLDLQGGVRHDLAPGPTRTYASFGIEGLAPYMIEVEARGFVATTGQVLARVEAWYDQRLTQRLVLQPRIELNLAAQDDAATRTGAGLAEAEVGLRLRYEIIREFAPYVGISYAARTGRSADFARADGHRPAAVALVSGIRFWF